LREDAADGSADNPDYQVSSFSESGSRRILNSLINLLQNSSSPGPKYLTGRSQADAAVAPFYEPSTQLLFQLFDLMTERRLGDIQQ
jgi:hypothetical protein